MKKLKILDWYVHQGAQYEFAKTGHDFYLCSHNGKVVPKWNENHRPLPNNIRLTREIDIQHEKFDIVIVRSGLNANRYRRIISRGAVPVAIVQTYNPFVVPKQCKHFVWNSEKAMKKNASFFPRGSKHLHIVHGFDPNEFVNLNLERNNRVLTVANVFKGRSEIMGYPLWHGVGEEIGCLDILGHGNEDIPGSINRAETFEELIRYYNTYGIFFNPTKMSAMPRSRGEAMMCGMPIVSTNNHGIEKYLQNGKNALLANNKAGVVAAIQRMMKSENFRKEMGYRARETAIKYFHINENIEKWNNLFGRL